MRSRMRMFAGQDDAVTGLGNQVSVKLAEVTTLLQDAHGSDRTWLMDFADDEVQVSRDLYEVLTAYRRLQTSH